ncbi:unnamed protein product, partial [Ixodes persulcatus]
SRLLRSEGVLEDEDDRVAAEEHLGNVAVLVHGVVLLGLSRLGNLRPHFLHILQNHRSGCFCYRRVTPNSPVECFYSTQQLFVVPAVDENLSVVFHRLRQHRERSGVELFFLPLRQFLWRHFTLGFL